MAAIVNNEPLRIVCTKCVRIVRVHLQKSEFVCDGVFVATECCERRFGLITGYVMQKVRGGQHSLTTQDICIEDVNHFADVEEKRANESLELVKWARWAGNATAVPDPGG